MRVEVITDQADTVGLRILAVQELLDLRGPVHSRLVLADTDQAHPTQRLSEYEDGGGAIPFLLIVVALGFARFCRQRLPDLLGQLHRLFIHAHQRDLGIIGLLIDLQDILHMCHKLPTLRRWNDPHLPQMRFQRIFLAPVAPSRG